MRTLINVSFPYKTRSGAGYTDSMSNAGKVRAMIGLPQLEDTDKNSVSMFNCFIEKEEQFIEKEMGVSLQGTNPRKSRMQANPGIGNQYGY